MKSNFNKDSLGIDLDKYLKNIEAYDGDMEYIQKAIEKYREHIVNL